MLDWKVVPVKAGWLWRLFCVRAPEGRDFDVVDNGWGLGYEEVLVDGARARRAYHRSPFGWFIPRIEFPLGEHQAAVNLQISGWTGSITRLELEADGQIIYRE